MDSQILQQREKRSQTLALYVQYRLSGSVTWTALELSYTRNIEDQIGFTGAIDVTWSV